MTTKHDRDNRRACAIALQGLCPSVPLREILDDVDALGRIGTRIHNHEERMCSSEAYYNAHIGPDGETDKTIERAEKRAAKIAAKYGATVTAGGDPRGFCLFIHRDGLHGNTWGGDEHGFGIN